MPLGATGNSFKDGMVLCVVTDPTCAFHTVTMDEPELSVVPVPDQDAVQAFFSCVKAVADPESLQTMLPALQRRLKQPPTALFSAVLETDLTDGQVGIRWSNSVSNMCNERIGPEQPLHACTTATVLFPSASRLARHSAWAQCALCTHAQNSQTAGCTHILCLQLVKCATLHTTWHAACC
jgi:hypothetical protein